MFVIFHCVLLYAFADRNNRVSKIKIYLALFHLLPAIKARIAPKYGIVPFMKAKKMSRDDVRIIETNIT